MQRKDISISLIVIILLGLAYIVASSVNIPTQAQGGDAPFVVLAEPKVQIISPGEPYVPIQFNITSLINVTDVTIVPQQSSVFTPSFQQSVHLPELLAYHWFNKTVFFFNVSSQATPGYHNVTLAVTYYVGSNPVPTVAYVSVPVLVLGYSTFVVSATWGTPSSPTIASPGSQDLPLTIVIINDGNSPAYNVTVVAYNTTYINFTKDYSYLGVVPPGTEVQAVLLADVSLSTGQGVYNVPIKIMYDNGLSYTTDVQVPVTGATSVGVFSVWGSLSDPIVVMPGQQNVPLTLVVKNLGTTTLYNVTVYVLKNDVITLSQNPVSIGVVPAGQYNYQTVTASVNSSLQPGVYDVPVRVVFNGNLGINATMQVSVVGYATIDSEAFWGSPSNPIQAAPGVTYYPLTIVLTNAGTATLTNVTIQFYNTSLITFYQPSANVGTLPPGTPFQLTVVASVSPSAPQGVISVPITLTYFNGVSKTVLLRVPITGYQGLQVQAFWGTTSSPMAASPGETDVPLTFVIRNLGTVAMSNVTITLRSVEYPFEFSQTVLGLGAIPAGLYSEATVTASVFPNATPGTYYIQLNVSSYGHVTTLEVPVTVYGPSLAVNLVTYPPQIFQGYEYAQLTLIVTNYGQGMAYNASVAVNTPLEVVGQKVINLGAIPPGRPVNVTFLITVPNDTRPGTYPVQFTVKYDGGEYSSTFNVTIEPEAQLRVVGVYGSLTGGASGVPLTIEIENVGNVTAKNLILTLGPNNYIYPHVSSTNPLMGLTASKFFAGDLKPGQAINVTFIVDTASDIPAGKVPVALIAVWNQTGSLYPFEQSMTIYVQVSPSFEQLILQPPYVYGLIAAIIAVIALLTLVGMRRRKSRS